MPESTTIPPLLYNNLTSPIKRRYYTPYEVSEHNCIDDCWVSFLNKVYNLTPLIKQNKSSHLIEPIVANAGRDISHWFDPATEDIKTWIDPLTNERCYYTPMKRFLHIPPPPYEAKGTQKEPQPNIPWWKDKKYQVGLLSKKTRFIRIINTLTHDDHQIEVCSEETLSEILERYLKFNGHAASYTWKRLGQALDMSKTLAENGIEDEDQEFEELGIRDDYYIPAIHLMYNDDLTIG
ncbi:hypothetical protein FDP41_009368 [Naegleria fowleri]|uniref:Cytochrome b5 domain-containing protein 1 n=1 Tax=Naegleria fowleri TaxID=5763 RepID=A0A6A5BEJ4_NAEFO|nr:uncharacterized protein FDP41_009368 [Naegleria fowleri]KAF0972465.1 hypothetical protein FDP41_009368 [Naegleria fowleri]CAG4718223.1 unnamed protein product [Naegleria fowleri]